jgi:Ca-activated chloride channel family protein
MRALLVALTLSVALAPQQPQFRSGAYTVAVYTTVSDASGKLVPDLGRDQFEVFDNGKRQTIATFANDVQPITVVMMLDRSGSMFRNFALVQRAAEAFVERMMAGDKARVGSFAARIQVDPRDFTSDRGELFEILRTELQQAGPTPLWNAVSVGVTALQHQEGRRVILVFTDGVDRPMNGSGNNASLRDVMKRAEQEDVMVYAIGLASEQFGGQRGGRSGGFGGHGGGGFGGFGGGGGPEIQKPDQGLPKIAGATGGGYFELTRTNDLASTFARVADELHHQYLLGFEPEKLDGKAHKLEVRLKTSGLTARARRTYVAARSN